VESGIYDPGVQIPGSGSRSLGLGFGVPGLGFGVWGLGFGVKLGFGNPKP